MRRPDNALRTTLLTLLAILAGLGAAFAPTASASSYSPSSYAARLLTLVNDARADAGLSPLRLASGTGSVAAAWTAHMADVQVLSHNSDLRHQIETHGSRNWTIYGENVGRGSVSNPDGLFRAYMRSPEHRDNILTGRYRYLGLAVVFDDSVAWNTFDFVDRYGTSAQGGDGSHRSNHHNRSKRHHPPHTPAPHPQSAVTSPPGDDVSDASDAPAARPNDLRQHSAHERHGTKVRVRVEGLRRIASQPGRDAVALVLTAAQPPLPQPMHQSSRAVLAAIAVLGLAAAARRWALAVTRV